MTRAYFMLEAVGFEWRLGGPAGDSGPLLVIAFRAGPMDYAPAGS